MPKKALKNLEGFAPTKEGLLVFIYKSARKLLNLFFGYEAWLVFERNLQEKITLYHAKIDVQFSLLSPDEVHLLHDELQALKNLEGSAPRDYNEADLNQARSRRIAQGDIIFVGYVNDQISTYVAINLKEKTFSGRHKLFLGKNKAFISMVLTIPSMRGFGLNPALVTFALTRLQSNGVTSVFTDVNRENIPSIRSIQKAGFQIIGSYNAFRILRWEWSALPPQLRRTIGS